MHIHSIWPCSRGQWNINKINNKDKLPIQNKYNVIMMVLRCALVQANVIKYAIDKKLNFTWTNSGLCTFKNKIAVVFNSSFYGSYHFFTNKTNFHPQTWCNVGYLFFISFFVPQNCPKCHGTKSFSQFGSV